MRARVNRLAAPLLPPPSLGVHRIRNLPRENNLEESTSKDIPFIPRTFECRSAGAPSPAHQLTSEALAVGLGHRLPVPLSELAAPNIQDGSASESNSHLVGEAARLERRRCRQSPRKWRSPCMRSTCDRSPCSRPGRKRKRRPVRLYCRIEPGRERGGPRGAAASPLCTHDSCRAEQP